MEKGKLKYIYLKSQKPVAYALLLIAILSPYTPYPQLLTPAVAALALLILNMLFAIEEKVGEHFGPREFLDFYHATLPMQGALNKYAKSKALNVKWIGTSMDTGWPFLRKNISRILEEYPASKVSLEIHMLSPDYECLAELNTLWPGQVKSNSEDILNWKDMVENAYPGRIEVLLCHYKSIPYYAGMLANDSTLFLAFTSWAQPGFAVGNNPYLCYEKQRGEGREEMRQFAEWAAYYRQKSS